ncbi:hypothetical protein ABK040_010025 [Willaertia magna]
MFSSNLSDHSVILPGPPLSGGNNNNNTSKQPLDKKEQYIQQQLKLKKHLYTEVNKIKIAIGTWNVNSKLPNLVNTSISNFLQINEQPEIIAIGLQEIDMTAEAMLKKETESKNEWLTILETELNYSSTKNKYIRIADKQLVGMCIAVFVNDKIYKYITNINIESLALGAMNVMGNKGGIGIRFKLFNSSICFVTSHLAPHMGAITKRNQNYFDIYNNLTFPKLDEDLNDNENDNLNELMIGDQHDYYFWFGDLNYRIDGLERDQVTEMLSTHHNNQILNTNNVNIKNIQLLLENDQLTRERMGGRVFIGFKEGKINFLPTYKYDPGTLQFDSSEKRRVPAYTDRILWKGKFRDIVKQLNYCNHVNCLISDHLPVTSLFEVDIYNEVDYKKKQLKEMIIKEYNNLLNNNYGSNNNNLIQLSCNEIYFENVRFNIPQSIHFYIKNISQNVCEYLFVSNKGLDPTKIGEDWLIDVSPMNGLILPNEQVEIKLTCCFNLQNSKNYNLNLINSHFEDNLMIHIENGKDYFIRVYGNYLISCYGNTLEHLVTCYQPVRSTSTSVIKKKKQQLTIPKELFFLCDYIFKYGLREEGLFQQQGTLEQIRECRELLDQGQSLSKHYTGNIHSICNCLITFLENLCDPIISSPLTYRKLMEYYLDEEKCKNIIANELSKTHYHVFLYLCMFLREVLMNSDANDLTADVLAQGFADVMIRSPQHLPIDLKKKHVKCKIQILKYFLTDEFHSKLMDKEDDQLFEIHGK